MQSASGQFDFANLFLSSEREGLVLGAVYRLAEFGPHSHHTRDARARPELRGIQWRLLFTATVGASYFRYDISSFQSRPFAPTHHYHLHRYDHYRHHGTSTRNRNNLNTDTATMAQSINKSDASGSLAVSHISGNLPTEVKQAIETVLHKVMARSPVFGSSISKHLVVTEASIVPKAEEASRTEARVVCEVTVGEGAASSLPLGRVLKSL